MDNRNVRALVLETLSKSIDQGAYVKTAIRQTLESNQRLNKQDRAFLTRLTNGVMERKMELDYIIDLFSSVPVCKMRPGIRNILRMGVYQILYMEGVPVRAACNESVQLAKKKGFGSLSGFVNGVLRSVGKNGNDIAYPDPNINLTHHCSIKYSVPEWIVAMWLDELGESVTKAMLEASLQNGPITIRCNTEKVQMEPFRRELRKAGIPFQDGAYHTDALRLMGLDHVKSLPGYREGWFQVQDESSMFVATCAGVRKGWRVLDVCAAPGGKALHVAQTLRGSGKVWACDITEPKLERIRENVQRLGFGNVEVVKQNALETRKEWLNKMDLVLADLPCSGFGVMGKKSDVKYRVKPEDLVELQDLQRRMLRIASGYVKPGGVLIYSTCTVWSGENEENAEWAARNLPLEPESLDAYLPDGLQGETTKKGYLQLIPGVHSCDGFFLSRFRRMESK